jgi:hypothetical protein
MYGVNYAWNTFAGDFGGIAMWEQAGVSGNEFAVSNDLADMAANGVSVVRWWVWPDFRGDGVSFNGDTAAGLGLHLRHGSHRPSGGAKPVSRTQTLRTKKPEIQEETS